MTDLPRRVRDENKNCCDRISEQSIPEHCSNTKRNGWRPGRVPDSGNHYDDALEPHNDHRIDNVRDETCV